MKNLIYVLLIPLFLVGCNEVDIETVIHKDGSCTRTVALDSSDIADTPFPINFSGAQHLEVTTTDKKNTYTADFASVKDMNIGLGTWSDSTYKIQIKPQLHIKFRWFYTFYRYQETWENPFHFKHVPIKDYMTEGEMALINSQSDSVESDSVLNAKIETWLQDNLFQEFYLEIVKLVKKGGLDITVVHLANRKQALHELFMNDLFDTDMDYDTLSQNDLTLLANALGTNAVFAHQDEMNEIAFNIMRELGWLTSIYLTDFTHKTSMPGLIIDTNASSIEGNTVIWKLDEDVFMIKDYEMWVESRTWNRWAVIVTGIVTIFLIGILLLSLIRNRK